MYLTLALVLAGLDYCSSDHHSWNYNDQAHWPEPCLLGKRQSPINIDSSKAVHDYLGKHIREPLDFTSYTHVRLRGLNNGHTVKFTVEGDEELRPTLSGGPLRRKYVMAQLHFHWLGEHSIDSIKYPLEIHFVHHRSDLTLEEATRKQDGIVVVAVFCKLSTNELDDAALRHLMKYVPVLENLNATAQVDGQVDLLRVLSQELDSYYTYEGSLTTPDCLEIATWIVLDTPIRFTDEQYKTFSAIHVGGVANFRSLQPLNGRTVFRTPLKSSGVSARPPGLLGTGAVAATLLSIASGTANALVVIVKNAVDSALSIKKKVFGLDARVSDV